MKRKLTEKKRRLITTFAWVALVAFLTFYIVFQLNGDFSPPLKLATAGLATETLTRSFEGYILRDEVVLTAQNGGYCEYLVSDGGYSASENELARVYPSGNAETAARISVLDWRIGLLEECSQRLTTGGMDQAAGGIGQSYRDLTASLSSGNTLAALEAKDGLLEDLFILEQNSGSPAEIEKRIAAAKAEIAKLKAERNSIISELGAPESIVSEGTGNFFYEYDGYEEIFTSVGLYDLDFDGFMDMFASTPSDETAGNPIGTYRRTHEWFFVIPCEMNDTLLFEVGGNYRVSFDYSSGHTLDMRLRRLVADPAGTDVFLVFSCGSTPEGFERTRQQTAKIEVKTYSGYRVMNQAIRTENGVTGVYKADFDEGKMFWKRVNVVYDNGVYSIVQPQTDFGEYDAGYLDYNDIYILSGSGLDEGKRIN